MILGCCDRASDISEYHAKGHCEGRRYRAIVRVASNGAVQEHGAG
jgi:hypothetical protein